MVFGTKIELRGIDTEASNAGTSNRKQGIDQFGGLKI